MKPSESSNSSALDRNIETIHSMRKRADQERNWDQRFVNNVTLFLGSTKNLYLHLSFYGISIGLLIVFGGSDLEVWLKVLSFLGTIATFEALFFTIFVLINQRHMNALERKNSDLHLQMSMLAEHEITRLIRLTDQIAKHLGIKTEQSDADLNELKKDVSPEQIVEKIFAHESQAPTDSTNDET